MLIYVFKAEKKGWLPNSEYSETSPLVLPIGLFDSSPNYQMLAIIYLINVLPSRIFFTENRPYDK